MKDTEEQDNNDLYGGFRWADNFQVFFFVVDCLIMLLSLVINFCLLKVMARNQTKESSIVYRFLVFFFFTSLIDDALLVEFFIAIFENQFNSTQICQFVRFVTLGNRLLQVFGVLAMLYLSLAMLELKSVKVENLIRKCLPLLFVGLVILEFIFALPPALNTRGTAHARHCVYIEDSNVTLSLTGWLYNVLFPYFIPLVVSVYPFAKIFAKVRQPGGVSERDRHSYQIVLSVTGGYFFFHFLYYLLWLGREIQGVLLAVSAFKQLLGLHFWYIARPLFATINLGWHLSTPLSPFIFDSDLLTEFPGPWINKNRLALSYAQGQEDIILEERNTSISEPVEGANGIDHPVEVRKVTDDNHQWREIHNPLPIMASDDPSEIQRVPL